MMNKVFYKIFPHSDFKFEQINPATPFDWSATYFQMSIEHALGYATDKKPDGDIICLTSFELTNKSIPIYELKDDIFCSNISGSEKAIYAKKLLNISENKILMKEVNGILILYDNPCDLEIIISHAQMKQDNFIFENIAQFLIKNHVITHWRKYGQNEWIPLTPLEKINPKVLTIKFLSI